MTQGKADNTKRIIAAIIDGIIAAFLLFVLNLTIGLAIPFIGGLLAGLAGAAYIGLKDALPIDGLDGASPGKKLLKLKTVTNDGANCDYETSIKRNLPFAAPYLFMALLGLIPILGAIISLLLWPFVIVIYIVELIFVLNKPMGQRWGDSFAGTQVIELGATTTTATTTAPAPPPPPKESVTPPADPAPPEETPPPVPDEETK